MEAVAGIVLMFGLFALAMYFGISGKYFNFDTRDQAAGEIIFLSNGEDLQDAINSASDSDAIFLRVGTYSTSNPEGFVIKNKTIRILGAGADYVTISGGETDHAFRIENASVGFENISIAGSDQEGVIIENGGSKEVSFRETVLENHSGTAIKSDSKLTIYKTLIDTSGSGITTSADAFIRNSVISNTSGTGIKLEDPSNEANLVVENSIIANNSTEGILLEGGNRHEITNVTIAGNSYGIVENDSASLTNVTSSIVQNSRNDGISLTSENSAVRFSNSYGNNNKNFIPAELEDENGNISIDSEFEGSDDYHLSPTSPLIDKGDTSKSDSDGTRMDVGAFGGNPDIDPANAKPVINSTPPNYVYVGEEYSYTVKATDPDSDELKYIVLNTTPSWIQQNGNSFTGTPSSTDAGFWGILLLVTDQKGHNIVHPISINVLNQGENPPTQQPTTTPPPTEEPEPTLPSINFIQPGDSTVFEGDTANLQWEISNGQDIEEIRVFYSDDNENFKLIEALPSDATSYEWNISDLTPGKYVLKVEADISGREEPFGKISEEFEVQEAEAVDGTDITIVKNQPADNDNVDTRTPTIIVEFKPDAELDREQTFMKINGEEVEYQVTQNSIFYDPVEPLPNKRAQVEVQLTTTDGGQTSKRWTFLLPVTAQPQETDVEPETDSTLFGLPRWAGSLLLILLVFLLLGALVYFVLKLLRTIRDERQGNLESEFTEYYTTPAQTVTPVPQQNAATDTQQVTTTTVTSDNQDMQDNSQASPGQQTPPPENTQDVTQTTTTVTRDNQGQTQTTTTTSSTDDAYISDLKQKYGITETDIQDYNKQQDTDLPPGAPPPDPSSASRPPKST